MTIAIISVNEAEAASSVRVSLPTFKVNLNGVSIENSYRQYPLIVYNDITYFPMTYYDSRFMGLESLWDNSTGLKIIKTGANWSYQKYESTVKNSNIYNAQIAQFKITVNGITIDNNKEKYPLILFKNVTYFPLTWRLAVEEFGWKYTFDPKNGLVINSTNSTPSAGQLTLPIVTREHGEKGAFTMAGDYFYYEGANGIIYQAPIIGPESTKKVYQLPGSGYGQAIVYANLKTENGKALLSYHTGGATMGSDHLIWLKEDGSFEEIDSGYSVMKIYDDYTIRVEQRFSFNVNNLQVKRNGEKDYVNKGNPDYSYGMFIYEYGVGSNGGRNGQPSKDLYLIGDEIYVLGYYGYYMDDNNAATTGIYKVNINNNEQVRLCDNEVTSFKVVKDTIYFTDQNQFIYKIPLTGGQAELLIDEAVNLYEVLEGKLYYSLKDKNNQLYIYGSDESVNTGGILKSLEVQNGYMVAIFDKFSESQYKMMIFNDNGKLLYKSIENVLLVRIENGKVVFVKDN
jgi:hypothetical protein